MKSLYILRRCNEAKSIASGGYKYELDKRFLYTKTKRPYSLEVLYKMLKDQCEEVNVIGEEKFS